VAMKLNRGRFAWFAGRGMAVSAEGLLEVKAN
jgi:hypothetical protein